jgi:hypothetical protein
MEPITKVKKLSDKLIELTVPYKNNELELRLTCLFHATEDIELLSLDKSNNILAWAVQADQRYAQLPSPTHNTFWDDQSIRLRQ